MRRVYPIMLFVLACWHLPAQDFRHAVDEARKAYGQADHLHAVMLIKVFESASSGKPYYSETADIKRHKNNYLYRYGVTEMLMNERYLVLVDKSSKEISFSRRDLKSEDAAFKDPMTMSLDSLLKKYKQTTYIGRKDNMDRYQLTQATESISRTDLFFDIRTKLIRRIEYHYPEGQHVSIEFQVFNQAPSFKADTFYESNYIVIGKDKIIPSAQYQGYNVSSVENQ